MSKLIQLRQVFGELILSLRRAFENLKANEGITLKGPTTVNQGDTVSWEITDHDVFSRYDVEVNLGTASVSGNTITYTHEIGKPVHSPFLMSVSCNETRRDVFVEMVQRGILRPYVISVESTFDGTGYKLTLKSQVFRVLPSNGDSHISTDWEISTNRDFTNVIWSSLNNTTNKTTIDTSSLTAGIKVFVRVRHKGSVFPPSPWFVGELLVDNQQTTSWLTSFDTIYSAGPTTTLSHNTSWLTEKLTMEYGVNNRITENVTSYRTHVGGEWLNVPKTTRYLTEHVTSLSRSTSWSTGRTTSMISGVGYSDPVARTTTFETSLLQNTFRNTYTSYVGTDGSLKEESMVTSWDTTIAATTSRETSYNSVHSHNTSIVTTYPTSHTTSYTTSWTTSSGASHVTYWNTAICIDPPDIVTPTAVYRDRMQVVWSNGIVNEAALFKSSNVWMMNEINNWYLSTLSRPGDKPNMEMYYQMYLSGSSYDQVKASFMGGANNELNVYPGAGKPIGVYSYCQYHFGTNARTTSANTSYISSYTTGQNTSHTTTYNTSHTTTWVTDIRYTSKSTSNNTDALTGR